MFLLFKCYGLTFHAPTWHVVRVFVTYCCWSLYHPRDGSVLLFGLSWLPWSHGDPALSPSESGFLRIVPLVVISLPPPPFFPSSHRAFPPRGKSARVEFPVLCSLPIPFLGCTRRLVQGETPIKLMSVSTTHDLRLFPDTEVWWMRFGSWDVFSLPPRPASCCSFPLRILMGSRPFLFLAWYSMFSLSPYFGVIPLFCFKTAHVIPSPPVHI